MAPLILLSNDDGIDSPYLRQLAEALDGAVGEVLVVAPERQRSAQSHTITLHKPLRIHEREPGRFAASGTPVDCVYIGLLKLAPRPPDLVISGINDGYNLGTDVFYSGTVGAAMEGALRGVTSLAASLAPGAAHGLSRAVDIVTAVAASLLATPPPAGSMYNLNIPPDATSYAWTHLGRRHYEDDVHRREDPRGRSYYWIGGGIGTVDRAKGSDCAAVEAGIASLTPLSLDRTAHDRLGDGALPLDVQGLARSS